jgi:photoactive yellow protein
MADRQDSNAAAPTPPTDWLANEWSELCDVLGTSDPEEVLPRVRTLKKNLDRIDDVSERPPESFVTISEVEEVFREMHDRLQKLRARNAQLVERLQGQDEDGVETAFKELHKETETLLEALGVTSVDEGVRRVQSMNRQLENLYHEKETLVEAGFTSAAEALKEIDVLQEKLQDRDSTPDTSVIHAASAMRNVLGVSSIGEAEDLVHSVREMNRQLNELSKRTEAVAEITGVEDPDDLAAMLDSMEQQLAELYREREALADDAEDTTIPDEVSAVLGVQSIDEARRLAEMVTSLGDRVQAYHAERQRITEETGVRSAEGVLEMIASMEEQLVDLYDHQQDSLPAEIGDILGVTTEEQARELESSVRSVGERLQQYRSERQRIGSQLAVQDADGVLNMVSSMEEQLVDLYDHMHKSLDPEAAEILGVHTNEEAKQLETLVRSMGEHVQRYRSQWQRVGDELAVQDADGVLDMVSSMEEQLVDLYDYTQKSLDPEIGEILGIQNPDQARELESTVRSMGQRLQEYRSERERIGSEMGVRDADGVLDMVYSMEKQLVDLYQTQDEPQNAPHEAASGDGGMNDETPTEIGRVLGVESVDEAEELANLVQDMTTQLERLTEEQEKLDNAGLTAEQAIAMIDTMEEQLVDLYQDRAEGRVETDILDDPSLSGSGDGSVSAVEQETESEVLDILGVATPEEARELADLVHFMSDQLERLTGDQEKLVEAGLTVDSALKMIDSMEEQLVDLYEDREADRQTVDEYKTVQSVLGVNTPREARELAGAVKNLHNEMSELQNERSEMLEETGMSSPKDVLAMIRSTEEQLVDLYQARETGGDATEQLDAIEETLGIRTGKGAREIAEMARGMNQEIAELEEERKVLGEVGLHSVSDAAAMIVSMQRQLEELYQERETTSQRASALEEGQDTFQQLEALYAEREKLERELGLASADDIIEMVEGLATQLDDLYRDRETVEDMGEDVQAFVQEHASEDDGQLMLASMERQLRDLYSEKERLMEMGYGSADEAARRIESLEQKRSELAQASAECSKRFERLERELGVNGVDGVVNLVRDLKSNASSGAQGTARSQSKQRSTPASSASTTQGSPDPSGTQTGMRKQSDTHPGFFIDAAPAFVPEGVLSKLETLNTDALDDLDFGVVRLSENGVVQFVNEAGLDLPGLKKRDNKTTILGKNFFFEIAPSTNNNLFFGRFKQGINQGAMDARFPYTFISPGRGPKVLVVHLHSKPASDAHWLLFRAM